MWGYYGYWKVVNGNLMSFASDKECEEYLNDDDDDEE